MTPDQNDELVLDRIIDSILKQPISDGPPEEARRRVLAIDDSVPQPVPSCGTSDRSFLADWIRVAAIAATILAALDLAWCVYVNKATPVGWFRNADTETWRVMYDNMRVEIRQPPAKIGSHL